VDWAAGAEAVAGDPSAREPAREARLSGAVWVAVTRLATGITDIEIGVPEQREHPPGSAKVKQMTLLCYRGGLVLGRQGDPPARSSKSITL
jgi:hypothetical protein